ncbi:MAG: tetratricopeptide repeat protein [Calothrix sp. FI2-JRJ7]|jgi:tetratricopeptide (TPR) repeat protein|nr:tetratricopeptide repeat protein [Calothrix sp. FI2-JRJ7]
MDSLFIDSLLEDLKNPSESVREHATQKLWRIWFQQKGIHGLEVIDRSQKLLDAGKVAEAELVLNELIQNQPDFAEAWNRRAFLYYTTGKYRESLIDCQKVIDLIPVHFGALHGMGLCYSALGEYQKAIQAFRRAVEIQPFSLINQKLILECMMRLG